MRSIPLIRVAALLPFTSFLREIGAPAESLWREAGLLPQALSDPGSFVPLRAASAFVEHAATACQIADLGLVVARRSGWTSAGAFGIGVGDARTIEQAIAATRLTAALHSSGVRYWLSIDADSARLCLKWRLGEDRFRQLDLFSVALLVDLVRLAAGDDWDPLEIDLQSIGAGELLGSEMVRGARVRQGQKISSVAIPRRLLRVPLRGSGARRPPVDPASRRLWRPAAPPADLVGSVTALIGSLSAPGRLGVDLAARAAGTSVRSLQRWLAEAGTSFSHLADGVRFAHAAELLQDRRRRIIDIACELGFSDAAHFTRAFRRWSGGTPIQYREDQHSGVERMRCSA